MKKNLKKYNFSLSIPLLGMKSKMTRFLKKKQKTLFFLHYIDGRKKDKSTSINFIPIYF